MAISPPREVVQRGLQNRPISYRRGAPRFGTMRARLYSMQGSSSPSSIQPPPEIPSNALTYNGEVLTYQGQELLY